MSAPLPCPQCTLENTYWDGSQHVCADCGYEWSLEQPAAAQDEARVVRDANGTEQRNWRVVWNGALTGYV